MHCEKRLVNRMFQSMQFLNAFVFAVGKCAWMHVKSEYRVLSFAEDRKHRTRQIPISLLRFVSVKSNQCPIILLWLIYQSGRWFFNHSLIKSIIASFVPGRAVIALLRCAPALNATIGHWMKKGLWLSAFAGLPAACWAIRFFLVFKWGHTWLPNSEFEAIWNQLKS